MDSFTTQARQAFESRPHRKSPIQVPCTAVERGILRELAAQEGVSVAALMRRLVAEYLAESEHQAAA